MLRVLLIIIVFALPASAAEVRWQHFTSARNELPLPSTARIQRGSVVGDFNGDKTNDFILSFGDAAPALVLYQSGSNWTTLPIEIEFLPIAAGGAAIDIDQDSDLDVVFGSETGPEIWWWENPRPKFDANKSWSRRVVKSSGSPMNRGQLAVDLTGSGWPQLVFWNQGSNALFHAAIPYDVRKQTNWPATMIFSPPGSHPPGTIQSLSALDLDIDGLIDLVAGNYWLKRSQGFSFEPTSVGQTEGLSAIGRFRDSTYPQLVIAPQTARGRVFWYECKTHPHRADSWAGRQLLGHEIAPAATLAIADLDKDGNDDVLLAERKEPSQTSTEHSPNAWIFYSDGNGNFRPTLFWSDLEIYDAKLVDLDNDSDLDIISTPNQAGTPRVDLWMNVTEFTRPSVFPK